MPCSGAHLQHEIWAVELKLLQWATSYTSRGFCVLERCPQLSAAVRVGSGCRQSTALSGQVSNDLLEAVQQAKAISQGNKGPPTAWSGPECSHSSRGGSRRTGQAFHGQRKGSVTNSCSIKALIRQGR